MSEYFSEKYWAPIIRDKENSLYNKTHLDEAEIHRATKYIMKKYSLNRKDALTKLINYAMAKKLKLKPMRRVGEATKLPYELCKLENLEEL